ncbi:hypothetical protein OROMI_012820 [Orobanche minor]
MIDFHGGMTVRRSPVKADGFVRHPFDLIDFDDLQVLNNKYLIDVVGYVTNVGRSTKQRTGSKTLDFYLTNQSGQSVRVTLCGSLGNVLIEKKIKSAGLHAVILTSVNAKLYNNKLYLSSSSSTLILDDAEIPTMKEFTSEARSVTYRLELDISDDTANTMVDEAAEDQPALPQALTSIIGTSQTLELKSHTYYEHGAYESFTCWYICAPELVDESAGSSTVSAGSDIGKPKRKRLFKSPLVSTPSKPSEDKRKKMLGTVLAYTSGYQITLIYVHSDTEITAAGSEVPKDDEDGEPGSKKKKKRYIMEDSESE